MKKLTRWSEVRNKGMTPKRIAKSDALVAREALNIRLRTLREAAGLTQAELAKRATLTQSQLSRLEASANVEMRSILRYARAAGADRVEITAVLGAKHIPLAIMGMTDPEKDKVHERKYGKPVKTSPSSVSGRKGGLRSPLMRRPSAASKARRISAGGATQRVRYSSTRLR